MRSEPTWPSPESQERWRALLDRLIESGGIRFRTDTPPDVHEPGLEHISGPLGRFIASRGALSRAGAQDASEGGSGRER